VSKRPDNVILITTDHMRYDCINAHGNPYIHTPNMDYLVNNGISFSNCFAQNPLCMPSRSSFMTGFYPQQVGVTSNGHCLDPDFPFTAPRLFAGNGYKTAQIGKLHFQPHENCDLDPRARYDYGFDTLWLSEEPGPYEDAYVNFLRNEWRDYVDLFRVPRSDSPERAKELNGRVIDAPWQASYSGWIAEQGSRFVKTRDNCFIHLGFYAPHPPLNPTKEMFEPYLNMEIPQARLGDHEWEDKPEPLASMIKQYAQSWTEEGLTNYRKHFYAMVTGVDLALGQFLATLRESGKLDNTLIVFTSDHGDLCGDHSMLLKQHSFYDELMHLPLLFFWPEGVGTEGRKEDDLVEMIDLLPTMLELSGGRMPPHSPGISYAEPLRERKKVNGRDDVLAYNGEGDVMLRTDKFKYIAYHTGGEVLYDYSDQKPEVINHINDSSYNNTLNDMRKRAMFRSATASASAQALKFRF